MALDVYALASNSLAARPQAIYLEDSHGAGLVVHRKLPIDELQTAKDSVSRIQAQLTSLQLEFFVCVLFYCCCN